MTDNDIADAAADFFDRPGDYYMVRVVSSVDNDALGRKIGFQFALKADEHQLPYAAEIIAQLRGSLHPNANVTMTKAQVLDRLPGNVEAYAIRPPERAPDYIGHHRAPDDAPGHFPLPDIKFEINMPTFYGGGSYKHPDENLMPFHLDTNTLKKALAPGQHARDDRDYSHIEDPDA